MVFFVSFRISLGRVRVVTETFPIILRTALTIVTATSTCSPINTSWTLIGCCRINVRSVCWWCWCWRWWCLHCELLGQTDSEGPGEGKGGGRERRSQQPADWTDRQLAGWFKSLISGDVWLKVISFMFCRMSWSQVTAEVQQKKNISVWSNVHVTEKRVRKQAANSQSSWTIELITFPLQNQQLTEEEKRTDEGWRVNVMEGEEEEDEGLGGVWCAETASLNEICSPSEILEETVCDFNTELRSRHGLLDSKHVSLQVQKNEHQAVWATIRLAFR